MGGEYRVGHFLLSDLGNILVREYRIRHLPITRHAATAQHSPEFHVAHQFPCGDRQCLSQAVMLMRRMDEQVGTVECVTKGVMIRKASSCS